MTPRPGLPVLGATFAQSPPPVSTVVSKAAGCRAGHTGVVCARSSSVLLGHPSGTPAATEAFGCVAGVSARRYVATGGAGLRLARTRRSAPARHARPAVASAPLDCVRVERDEGAILASVPANRSLPNPSIRRKRFHFQCIDVQPYLSHDRSLLSVVRAALVHGLAPRPPEDVLRRHDLAIEDGDADADLALVFLRQLSLRKLASSAKVRRSAVEETACRGLSLLANHLPVPTVPTHHPWAKRLAAVMRHSF